MHTAYFSLKRRKTSEFNEILAEQNKLIIHHEFKILEKLFELQKEQLLEEAFEDESQAQLANLERKSHSSSDSSNSAILTLSFTQGLVCYLPKPKNLIK